MVLYALCPAIAHTDPLHFCRFVAIMAPAVIKLQRLLRLPGIQDPQTPHEAWFTKHFRGHLLAAVAALQSPDKEMVAKPERASNELKSLLRAISTSMGQAFPSPPVLRMHCHSKRPAGPLHTCLKYY